MKGRPRSEPGVVLLSSLDQLEELAVVNDNIRGLYQSCWQKDILLGCILPWHLGRLIVTSHKTGHATWCRMHAAPRASSSSMAIRRSASRRISGRTIVCCHLPLRRTRPAKGNRGQLQYVGDDIIAKADHLVFADNLSQASSRRRPSRRAGNRASWCPWSMARDNSSTCPS